MNNCAGHRCIDGSSISEKVDGLPSEEVLSRICNIFGAFQCKTRLKILFLLSGGGLCVRELESALGMSQSAISHSLRTLRQLDFVRVRKEGRFAVYHIADEHVKILIDTCLKHVTEDEK